LIAAIPGLSVFRAFGPSGLGDLVQQRLEHVVVATVNQPHINRSVSQGLGCCDAGKASADDEHFGECF
jgi:hypothetical protein